MITNVAPSNLGSLLEIADQFVLGHMQEHGGITEASADLVLGVRPLAPVIERLCGYGHVIKRFRVPNPDIPEAQGIILYFLIRSDEDVRRLDVLRLDCGWVEV